MNKLKRFNSKFISIVFLIIVVYILGVNFFYDRENCPWMYYNLLVDNKLIMLVALGLVFIIFILKNKKAQGLVKEATQDKKLGVKTLSIKRLLVFQLILLVLQIVIVKSIYLDLGWDVLVLKYASYKKLAAVSSVYVNNYFATNSNNIFMYAITYACVFLGVRLVFNGYSFLVLIGIVLNNLAVLFTVLSVDKIFKNLLIDKMTFVLSVLLFGLSPWMVAPYTDIFSILLPILSLYIYLQVKEGYFKKWFGIFLIVLVPCIGYILKPTNIFILLAIAIAELLSLIERRAFSRKVILEILYSVVLSLILVMASKALVYKAVDYHQDLSSEKTIAHYLLLGSNTENVGMYNQEDDDYTNQFQSQSEKNQGDIKLIKQRLHKMGLVGYLQHMTNKTYMNYSMGIFGWGKEVDFYKNIPKKNTAIEKFLCNIYYISKDGAKIKGFEFSCGGKYFKLYASFAQLVWMVALILIFIGSFFKKLKISEGLDGDTDHIYENIKRISFIVFIGLFVFLTLFETNARYLFSYLPIFMVLAGFGIEKLEG